MDDKFNVIFNNDYAVKRCNGVLCKLGADYPIINGGCCDVTKSHVDKIFAEVFGYSSIIDPTNSHYYLKKSEKQGDKSGEVVEDPHKPEEGYIYQKIINNILGGYRIDYRTHIIGGEIVWVREKWKEDIVSPELIKSRPANDVFMTSEKNKILDFCQRIGLNFGELDILKDYSSGKIYIVDVNDMPGVRRDEPKQPGYKEELNTLLTKFKEYYDYCLKVKDTRGCHSGCVC